MKRILVIGNCGVGKTTLSKKLAQKLMLPLIHLDYFYWKPNWTKPGKEEWRTKVRKLVKNEKWVMDGNYRSTFDIRVPASDTIIFLDFPKQLSLFRVFFRYLKNIGRVRHDIGGSNYDKIDFGFIKWIWSYSKAEMLERIRAHKTTQSFIHIKNAQDIENFLKSI